MPRLDQHLVETGRFESRARAQAAIAAGLVSIDGIVARKASASIPPGATIEAAQPHPYVSRGGVKLAAALDAFGLDPAGQLCLDVGASTGGFSDCLLQRHAAHVTTIDTGRDQLHPSLRNDPRISVHEGQDVRRFEAGLLEPRPTLAVIDVSFISLRLVLPPVAALLAPACYLVALVKPQFEVGKGKLGSGGIVRDAEARRAAVAEVRAVLATLGFVVIGEIESPIAGGDGNVEYLLGARRQG